MKTTTRQPLTFNDMAVAFGIVKGDDRAKARSVQSRLAALGYVKECGRCGGDGHYSYNQITGTRCFGCGGSGRQLIRITADVLAEAVARQAAGELDAYFAANKARGDARRAIGPILATFDAEWSGGAVHTSYKAVSFFGRRDAPFTSAQVVESADFRAAGLVNSLHSAAHEIEFQSKREGFDALAGVDAMRGILALLREVNAAWTAYDGADRLSAR
jgi:hypothetical protein